MKENEPERVRPVAEGVRLRVLAPLSVALLLLVLMFISMFSHEARKRQAEDIARTAASVEAMYRAQSEVGVRTMRTVMKLVMSDRRLEAALRARDRKALLDISAPILKEIQERNRITHFYYILPDRSMLLRVQVPDKYGDRIDRFVLQQAQRTGKPFWGNEQGPFGTFTLRVAAPWYGDGELLGYLEMGIEFEDIMQAIKSFLDVEVFVAIDKQYFDRVKWDSAQKRKAQPVAWDEFPSVVLLSRTTQEIPRPIVTYLAGLKGKHLKRSFEVAWDGRVSQTIVAPFTNLRGEDLGEMVVLRDITAAAGGRRRGTIWVAALCAMVGGLLMAFFHVLLGRVQHDVAERTSRLTEAQRVLTLEQVGRQKAERELVLQQERNELLEAKGRMLQELEKGAAELRRLNEKLESEIAERRQAEERISVLNEELEQKVQERTGQLMEAHEELLRKEKLAILGQLSGSVGHELRSPLGVMSNAVYFLRMVIADGDETTEEYLGIIEEEIANSRRIITDLLDFARTRLPQREATAPGDLVRQSLERCVIPESVEVAVEVPDDLPSLGVDPLQLGQVLTNFIDNAVQAMPNGGLLRIGAQQTGNAVAVFVADSGEGISPENMKRLFQPLFTTKAKGVGLGLVVCRNLVEANGGRIEVESEVGKGTTFTVLLPAMAATASGSKAGKDS